MGGEANQDADNPPLYFQSQVYHYKTDRLAFRKTKFLKGKVQLPSVSRESHPQKELSRRI